MGDNTRAIAKREPAGELVLADAVERLVVGGDLSGLEPAQRVEYYRARCAAIGVSWISRPFDFLKTDGGGITLYANQNCAAQLRDNRRVNIRVLSREQVGDLYIVTVQASLPDGRCQEATGIVSVVKEKGDWRKTDNGKSYFVGSGEWVPIRGTDLANAMMKAETKAIRRATLALCGMGGEFDEPEGRVVDISLQTGEEPQPDPRDEAPLQTPRAASRRFHSRPEAVDAEATPAEPSPAPAKPAPVKPTAQKAKPEPTPAPTQDGPTLAGALPEALATLLRQVRETHVPVVTPTPWEKDPKSRGAKLAETAGRLKLFEFGDTELAALYQLLHFASTGELVPAAKAPGTVAGQWILALQSMSNAEVEALHDAARWLIGWQKGGTGGGDE